MIINGLDRRSHRQGYNWTTFGVAWVRWKVPLPDISRYHGHKPDNPIEPRKKRLTNRSPITIVDQPSRNPEEPDAVIPHAGIWKRADGRPTSLPKSGDAQRYVSEHQPSRKCDAHFARGSRQRVSLEHEYLSAFPPDGSDAPAGAGLLPAGAGVLGRVRCLADALQRAVSTASSFRSSATPTARPGSDNDLKYSEEICVL